jgi:hypothetical protein
MSPCTQRRCPSSQGDGYILDDLANLEEAMLSRIL